MTTTKEDRIREEFCLWFDTASPDEFTKLGAWRACAESYEKKLAELNSLIQENAQSWAEQHVELLTTRKQLSEANARNARLVEALHLAQIGSCSCLTKTNDAKYHSETCLYRITTEAITANSESVAAWEAEKLEPLRRENVKLRESVKTIPEWMETARLLRREVAMLRDVATRVASNTLPWFEAKDLLVKASDNTQATAEAYEREVVAKAQIQILEESYQHMQFSSSEFFLTPAGCISYLCGQANKIRANKVKGD